MEKESILLLFPEATDIQIKAFIKYQDKFNLTLENLKCLNPNCNQMKKWFNTTKGFAHTCGNQECQIITKEMRYKTGSDKAKQTFLTKYGVSNPSQLESVKIAKKETCLKNSGFDHNMKNPDHIKKREKTSLIKYGVSNPSKLESVKSKLRSKPFKHQSHIFNLNDWNNPVVWKRFINDDFKFDYVSACLYFNCKPVACYNQLKKLKIYFKKWNNTSLYEKHICEFVKTIIPNDTIQENIRIPNINEIDIFIPDKRIAIEYNGIYWHSYCPNHATSRNQSDLNYCKNRHLYKTNECLKQDIRLFHIFENEWLNPNKQLIWKSILENALGKSIRLGARKCELKSVPKKDIRHFLEENHLQGYGVSPIAYGLYYKNELVSLMTFASGKGRMDSKTDWELVRFCNKRGYNIQGAASRLLKAFRTKYPGSIKSYANRRWSDGNLYRQLGFQELGISAPNHFYWLDNILDLKSRQKFQKHKQSNILINFDQNKRAIENMINSGYKIIWDSGNYVFILKKEE